MKFVDEIDVKDKKVILRCDLNVPIEDGIISDDSRIKKSLKTINYLLDNNCSIILMSHLGRVKVEEDKAKCSLRPVADRLSELLEKEIDFADNPVGMDVIRKVNNLQNGDILLLENTRYCDFPEKLESSNNANLAEYWSTLGDLFVCDAFGALHRAHASVCGISDYLPTVFGLLVKEEVNNLLPLIENTKKPFGVFMGGAKIDDKLKYIKDLLERCDYLLIGGGIANAFLYAIGYDIGDSICTNDELTLEEVRNIYEKYKEKIILPIDFVIEENKILDLGEKTIEKYLKYFEKCQTIFINGTPGKFEEDDYAKGTIKLLKGLKDINAYKVAGGGDTINAIKKFAASDSFDYLSSGGGASLEYISSTHLEAIDYISNK